MADEFQFDVSAVEEEDTILPFTLDHAFRENPETYARNMRLSQASGVPVDAVATDPDAVEFKLNFEKADYGKLTNRSPITARYLSDYNNAVVAQEDISLLEGLERTFSGWGESFGLTMDQLRDSGELKATEVFQKWFRAGATGALDTLPEDKKAQVLESFRFADNLVLDRKDQLIDEISSAAERKQELTPEDLNLVQQSLRGAADSVALMAPGLIATMITKNPSMMLGIMGAETGLLSYADGRAEGLTDAEATQFGIRDAIIEIATEMLPAAKLTDIFAGKMKGELGKGVLQFLAREVPGEQLATLGQSLNALSFGLDEELENAETAGEMFEIAKQRAAVTLLTTLFAGGAQVGAVAGTRKIIDHLSQQEDDKTVIAARERMTLQQLNDFAAESKLAQRSPESMAEFVKELNQGPNASVYIDPAQAALYLQENQESIEKDGALIFLQEKLTEAQEGGTEIEILVEEFITTVAGTPHFEALLDTMTMDPKSTAPFRVAQERQSTDNYIARLINEAEEDMSSYAEAQDIYQQVRDQLIDTGRLDPQQASVSADLVPAWATVFAARNGLSVAEVFERSGLTIVGPETGKTAALEAEKASFMQQVVDTVKSFLTSEGVDQEVLPPATPVFDGGVTAGAVIDAVTNNEGITLTPDGQVYEGTDGYVVSVRSMNVDDIEYVPALVQATLRSVAREDRDDMTVGVFSMPEGGYSVDTNIVIQDRDEAEVLGREFDQHSIWDLGAGGIIETGGTGEGATQQKYDEFMRASREQAEDLGTGQDFTGFFSNISVGLTGKPKDVPYVPAINVTAVAPFIQEYEQHRGNFDDHIGTSIPTFRELQTVVGDAIVKTYGVADMLDIGASEGALVKTISSLSNGNIQTVALDPNFAMARHFNNGQQVTGSQYVTQAFGTKAQEGKVAWTEGDVLQDKNGQDRPNPDSGVDVTYYTPDRQFDIVHEAMVFQFMSGNRDAQVARAKEMMKDDGVLILEEKFVKGDGLTTQQFRDNESQKDAYKSNFFSAADIKAKAKAIGVAEEEVLRKEDEKVVGMNDLMVSPGSLENTLGKNFKYVVQFWDSGNFKGYVASDSASAIQELLGNMESVDSSFSKVATPRTVTGDVTADFKPRKNVYGQPPVIEHDSKNQTEFGKKLDEIAKLKHGSPLSKRTEENKHVISDILVDEILDEIGSDSAAADWYKDSVTAALAHAADLHPEIANDPLQKQLFIMTLALTSNGAPIKANVQNADAIYEHYKATGEFLVAAGGGSVRAKNIQLAFDRLAGLINNLGLEETFEFLNTKFVTRDLEKMGFTVSGENADTVVYGSSVFGPKIGGGFFQNLSGNHDVLTMDLWFMKSWGRITGTLVNPKNGKLVLSPTNGGIREWMREVVEETRVKLLDQGVEVDTAAIQALLWYREKDLYKINGMNSEKGEATDYETEFEKLANRKLGRRTPTVGDRSDAGAARLTAKERAEVRRNKEPNVYAQSPAEDRLARARALGFDTENTYYHGSESPVQFDSFNVSNTGTFGKGVYFTSNKNFAEEIGEEGHVVEAHLRMRNPYEFNVDESLEDKYDYDSPAVSLLHNLLGPATARYMMDNEGLEFGHFDEQLTNELIDRGYDGIIATFKDGDKEIVVFDSKNVRSVNAQFKDGDSSKLLAQSPVEDRLAKARALGFDTETVYTHTTKSEFDSFDTKRESISIISGAWFNTRKEAPFSESYMGDLGGANTIPVYLRVKNSATPSDVKQAINEVGGGYTSRQVTDNLISKGFDSYLNDVSGEIAVFDSKNIRSVNAQFEDGDSSKLLAQSSKNRGTFDAESITIRLGEASDASTFLHEFAHFMFEQEMQFNGAMLPGIEAWFKRNASRVAFEASTYMEQEADPAYPRYDYPTTEDVIAFFDKEQSDDALKDGAIMRALHEQFARGFETYLMEGRAPSVEMRNVFATMARWLTEIYKKIRGNLDVNLDNEMREVFDRMLATDEQIEMAKARAKFEPLFTDAAMAGMTEAKFKEYQEQQEKAKDKEQETLRTKLIAQLRRRATQWWNEEHQDIVDQQQEILKEQQVYKTREAFRNGEIKLDHAAVKEMVGETVTNKRGVKSTRIPPMLKGMTLTGMLGVHPDEAAAAAGYNSGAEMLEDLITAPTIKKAAEDIATQEMLSRHGDMMNDGTIEAEADRALKSEEHAKALMIELRNLARGTTVPALERAVIRDIARQRIGKLSFRQINVAKHRKAEIKAAQAAAVALEKGDKEGAAQAKMDQLMQFYLGMEAQEARDGVTKIVDRTARYRKPEVQKQIKKAGNEYWEQLVRILERFEFRKSATLKSVDQKNTALNVWVQQRAEQDGDALELSPEVLDASYLEHWKNIPYARLQAISESIRNIEHVARFSNKITLLEEEVAFEKIVKQWTDEMAVNNETIYKPQRTTITEGRKWGAWSMAQMVKIPWMARWLDGGKTVGLSHQLLVQSLVNAQSAKFLLFDQALKPVVDAMNFRSKEDIKRHNTKVYIKEIADEKNDGNLMGHQILAVALNTGNQSNLRKLLLGEGWANKEDEADISLANEKLQAVLKHMTKSDWLLVQLIWNQMDSLYPQLAEVHRRATGLTPPKIEATPVETKFGTFAGGYYPVKYDSNRSQNAKFNEERLDANTESMFSSDGSIHSSVTAGATNERNGFYDPIRLSLDIVPNHFEEVIHYITHFDAVRQINKLINNAQVANMIQSKLGVEEYNQLKPWLNDIAKEGKLTTSKSFIDDVFGRLRFGITLAYMGFKVSTGLIQVSGLSNSAAEVGFMNIARVLPEVGKANFMRIARKILGKPESMDDAWAFAMEHSKVMPHRVRTMDREMMKVFKDINDPRQAIAKEGSAQEYLRKIGRGMNPKWMKAVQETSMKHIMYIQLYTVDLPTWHAAYAKKFEETGDEKSAFEYADWVIENVQGSGATKDLAAVMRGKTETHRMFTMFMTFFSAAHNAQRDLVRSAKSGKNSVTTTAAKAMLMITAPVIFEMFMRGDHRDEDDEIAYEKMLLNTALFPVQSIPFLRDLASGAIGDYGYNISPAASMLERGVLATPKILEGILTDEEITKSQAKNASALAFALLGVPGVNQAWATGEHLYQVIEEGEELTTHQLLFGPER